MTSPIHNNGINNTTNTLNKSKSDPVTGNAPAGADNTHVAAPGQNSDEVQLSDTASKLQNISDNIMNLPEVDMEKVEYFKDLIAKGEYKIDAEAIAKKIPL